MRNPSEYGPSLFNLCQATWNVGKKWILVQKQTETIEYNSRYAIETPRFRAHTALRSYWSITTIVKELAMMLIDELNVFYHFWIGKRRESWSISSTNEQKLTVNHGENQHTVQLLHDKILLSSKIPFPRSHWSYLILLALIWCFYPRSIRKFDQC